ncbi:hypothetical protein KDA23_04740, partial [Candidatus Saccharibacteria bacterium]|nr:hypothetical protein [Candidatus Saccharibacteria bacterium]
MKTETIIGGLVVLLLLGVAGYFFLFKTSEQVATQTPPATESADETPIPVEPDGGIGDGAEPLDEMAATGMQVIGRSEGGNDIVAYHYGTGEKEILLVAGVHGAYAANTSQLAHELNSYLESATLPEDVRVTVIPVLNPDGLQKIYEVTDVVNGFSALRDHNATIPGRFNANNVDLNRNFDCEWAPKSMWRSQEVSGGSAVFSESEAATLRDYVIAQDPVAAIVWFSAEGKVYPSACGGAPSSASTQLASTFAKAAG